MMKHLKRFNESTKFIESICESYDIRNYVINTDKSIDVDGNVYLNYKK